MLNQKFASPPTTTAPTEVIRGFPYHNQPASPAPDTAPVTPAQPGCCPLHPAASHWLQLGKPPDSPLADYRCMVCSPPPSPVFVQRVVKPGESPGQIPQAATNAAFVSQPLAQPIVVTYERPVCSACGGRWVQEIDRPSGVVIRCWTCKEPIELTTLDEALGAQG